MSDRDPQDLAGAPAPDPGAAGPSGRPEAPGLIAMLGHSVAALFRAPWLFEEIALLPTPDWWVMAANLGVFIAAAQAASLLLGFIDGSGILDPLPLIVVHATGLAGALVASFVLAFAVDLITRVAGADGGLSRSYQIVSLSSGAALVGFVAQRLTFLWFLPVAWAAFLIGSGIHKLHQARPAPAWAMVCLLAGLALGGQWQSMKRLEALVDQTRAVHGAMTAVQELRAQMERALPLYENMPPASTAPGAASNPAGSLVPPLPPTGSADLIQAPQDAAQLRQEAAGQLEQNQAMMRATQDMLRSLMPMINNPQYTKNMPPEQAKQARNFGQMIEKLSNGMEGKGAGPSSKDIMQMMQSLMQLQQQAAAQQPAGAGPTQPKKKTKGGTPTKERRVP